MTKSQKKKIEPEAKPEDIPIIVPSSSEPMVPDPMQQFLSALEEFRKHNEELLSEVNELKAKMATKEFVSASVVQGINEFSKHLTPVGDNPASIPQGDNSKAGQWVNGLSSILSSFAAIAKSFQPASDPRILQLGEAGLEFSRIAIMNAMKVQARSLGFTPHLEMEAHAAGTA